MKNRIFYLFLVFALSISGIFAQEAEMVTTNLLEHRFIVTTDDYIYFSANSELPTGYNERLLWRTDGTENNTTFIRDKLTGEVALAPRQMYTYKNKVYFIAYEKEMYKNPPFLWVTDDSNEGAKVFRDFGRQGHFSVDYDRVNFIEFKDKLFFTYPNGLYGYDLFMTDGTEKGIELVKKLYQDNNHTGNKPLAPNYFKVVNDKLFFTAYYPEEDAHGLWVSDGTAEGTRKIGVILYYGNDPFQENFHLYKFHEYQDKLIFTKNDSIYGYQPWVTDGTTEGTFLLKRLLNDVNESTSIQNINNLFTHRGKLVVQAENAGIWVFNHVENPIPKVANRTLNTPHPLPLTACSYDGEIYYLSDDLHDGVSLVNLNLESGKAEFAEKVTISWVSPGTNDRPILDYNNRIYFIAGLSPGNLYQYDKYENKVQEVTTKGEQGVRPSSVYFSGTEEKIEFKGSLYFTSRYDNILRLFKLTTEPTDINKNKSCDCNLYVYPNPASDYFTVEFYRENPQPVEFKIYDVMGQLHDAVEIDQDSKEIYHTFDTSSLQSAIYFLKVKTGEHKLSRKIRID